MQRRGGPQFYSPGAKNVYIYGFPRPATFQLFNKQLDETANMASPTPETTSRSVDVPKTSVVDSFSSMSVMELLKQIKEKSLQEGLVVILEEEGHLEDLPESTRLRMVALVSETKLDAYSLKDKSMAEKIKFLVDAEKSGVSSKVTLAGFIANLPMLINIAEPNFFRNST